MQSWSIRSLDVVPHQPQILRSDAELRAIVLHLPAGEELQEHQVHERAYVIVADGEVVIEQDGTTEAGGPGYVVHFDPGERHSVRATTDARLLLMLTPWPGEGHPSRP